MQRELIERLKKAMPSIKRKYSIEYLSLFGSILRDDFTKQSDVDILVDFQSDDALMFLDLADELELILNRKIDLVSKRSLKPRHLSYIEKQLLHV